MARLESLYDPEKDLEQREKEEKKKIKKRRKIVRTAYEPLLPGVIKWFFWALLILLPTTLITEIIVTVQGKSSAGVAAFFYRSARSLSLVWLFLGIPVLLLSFIQLYRYNYRDYRDMIYKFIDEISDKEADLYTRVSGDEAEKEVVLYAREDQPTDKKYIRYIRTTLIIGAIVILYFLIAFILKRA